MIRRTLILNQYFSHTLLKKTLAQLLLILTLVACGGEVSTTPHKDVNTPPATLTEYRGDVQGIVVDANEIPVEGVKVYLGPNVTLTDSTGLYVFSDIAIPLDTESLVVTITSPDHNGISVEISPANQVSDSGISTSFIDGFVIEAPIAKFGGHGTIAGTVLTGGSPLEYMQVTLKSLRENEIVEYTFITTTDAGGQYVFSDIPFYDGQESFFVQVTDSANTTVTIEILPIHQIQNTGGQGNSPIDNANFTDGFTAQAPQIIFQTNSAPVANSGSYQIVTLGEIVTLDGSASFDADGDTITYLWNELLDDRGLPVISLEGSTRPEGEAPYLNGFGVDAGWPVRTAELDDVTSATPSFVASEIGEYRVPLIVNDGKYSSQISIVEIDVVQANIPPVANAGEDVSVLVNNEVTLDGNLSLDVNNDFLAYQWSFTSVPNGSSAVLRNELTDFPSFTPDVEGEYLISLIVNDGEVDSEADSVVVIAEAESIKLFANDLFSGWSERPMPFSVLSNATGSVLGVNYFEISKYQLTAAGNDFVIRNLTATDANSVVVPYFDGLRDGQVIADGTTVDFSLVSPLTGGAQSNLTFYFSIEGTNKTFNYSVLLQTN